jgi:hypothetical protein
MEVGRHARDRHWSDEQLQVIYVEVKSASGALRMTAEIRSRVSGA